MLVPCAIIAYFFPMSDYLSFFFDYQSLKFADWGQLWLASFNHSPAAMGALACAFVLLVPTIAYVATVITRHIRVGEFALPKILYSVNENFFPALSATLFFAISVFVAHTLYTLFLYMWMRTLVSSWALALSVITFLLIIVLLTYVSSATTLWLPIMSFTGMYVFKSLGLSFSKAKNHKNFFLTALIITVAAFAVSLIAHFTRHIWYVKWIIHSVIYAFVAVFFVVYNMISYCEAESITREDLAKRYFGR